MLLSLSFLLLRCKQSAAASDHPSPFHTPYPCPFITRIRIRTTSCLPPNHLSYLSQFLASTPSIPQKGFHEHHQHHPQLSNSINLVVLTIILILVRITSNHRNQHTYTSSPRTPISLLPQLCAIFEFSISHIMMRYAIPHSA